MSICYVNEWIVDCRLKGIYRQIYLQKYKKASDNISQMIMYLKTVDIEMNKIIYNEVIDTFYHMLVEMAFKKYNSVHNRARDLHYKIRFNKF